MLLSPSSSRAWSQLGAPSRLGSWVISTVILVPKYLSSACASRLNWDCSCMPWASDSNPTGIKVKNCKHVLARVVPQCPVMTSTQGSLEVYFIGIVTTLDFKTPLLLSVIITSAAVKRALEAFLSRQCSTTAFGLLCRYSGTQSLYLRFILLCSKLANKYF